MYIYEFMIIPRTVSFNDIYADGPYFSNFFMSLLMRFSWIYCS